MLITQACDSIDTPTKAHLPRGAHEFSADGLTGLEANLRPAAPRHGDQDLRLPHGVAELIFQRPNAVGPDGALAMVPG